MLLVAAICVGIVYLSYALNLYTIERLEDQERFGVGEIGPDEDGEVDRGALPEFTVKQGNVVSGNKNEVINILLIGSDGLTSNSRGRSDSILIATIDIKNRKLKVTSIMRDMWVCLPGTDANGKAYGWNKINAAYSYGDAAFLLETIEYNFNISIDLYARVNFKAFSDVIDIIGGIQINLSKEEASYLKGRNEIKSQTEKNKIKAGMNTLKGQAALEFARARHAGSFTYTDNDGNKVKVSNDFARTARQRYVLQTMLEKAKKENLRNLLSIAEKCAKNTKSNIPLSDLLNYIEIALGLGTDNILQMQIPCEGLYVQKKMPSGAAVLYMSEENMKSNSDKMREFIFE